MAATMAPSACGEGPCQLQTTQLAVRMGWPGMGHGQGSNGAEPELCSCTHARAGCWHSSAAWALGHPARQLQWTALAALTWDWCCARGHVLPWGLGVVGCCVLPVQHMSSGWCVGMGFVKQAWQVLIPLSVVKCVPGSVRQITRLCVALHSRLPGACRLL